MTTDNFDVNLYPTEVVDTNIGNRIRQVRKSLGLNQIDFGERIGYSTAGALSKLELGANDTSEQTIKLICREFQVDEDWLRNGTGEMFKVTAISDDSQVIDSIERILAGENEMIKRVFRAAARLPKNVLDAIEAELRASFAEDAEAIQKPQEDVAPSPYQLPGDTRDINELFATVRKARDEDRAKEQENSSAQKKQA